MKYEVIGVDKLGEFLGCCGFPGQAAIRQEENLKGGDGELIGAITDNGEVKMIASVYPKAAVAKLIPEVESDNVLMDLWVKDPADMFESGGDLLDAVRNHCVGSLGVMLAWYDPTVSAWLMLKGYTEIQQVSGAVALMSYNSDTDIL